MKFMFSIALILILSCTVESKQENPISRRDLTEDFKSYWFAGKAELTSYKLEQARYGEIHSGSAMLIFVTEDFSKVEYTKADRPTAEDVPVLKLNATKNFLTGIYPYSMMRSIFQPLKNTGNALKVSMSSQEWCGNSYMQLLNKDKYEIDSHSYFGGEADQKLSFEKVALEDEVWTKLRINPAELPLGKIEMIPSFFFLRLRHVPIKAYEASAKLIKGEKVSSYEIMYEKLQRNLKITFENKFPYQILSWEEESMSGWGEGATVLKTKATKLNTVKNTYWNKNKNKDRTLREELGLD